MLQSILKTLSNCFKIPELKSRILFTILILAICRLTSLIPCPGLNGNALSLYFQSSAASGGATGGLFGMASLFTGGGFERCAIGTLGIMPYISATIILQLLQAVIPFLSKKAREEGGRTWLIQAGRVLTVFLCLGQAIFMVVAWEHAESVFSGFKGQLVVMHPIWWYRIQTTVILTTGTVLLMWLGEQITDRGIGNGISLIITVGILARLPQAGRGLLDMFFTKGPTGEHSYNAFHFIALVMLLCAVVAGVVAVTQAERKIP
ncbi:MAG TPA: preprotein translocase subunit SecY, partial [Verrucomicrobiae bacterium]|nr:preprotein translocase subunit SecY [Verrucomicrobiae bacterium]